MVTMDLYFYIIYAGYTAHYIINYTYMCVPLNQITAYGFGRTVSVCLIIFQLTFVTHI